MGRIPPFPIGADLSTFIPARPGYDSRWDCFEWTDFESEVMLRAERLAVALQGLLQAHHATMDLIQAYELVKEEHAFPNNAVGEAVMDYLDLYWMHGGIARLREHLGYPARVLLRYVT